MGYLSAADIQARIEQKKAQLAAANRAYLSALENGEVQTYNFDSGEGRQSATRRKPAELKAEIHALENEIAGLERQLRRGGLCNMNLRRG